MRAERAATVRFAKRGAASPTLRARTWRSLVKGQRHNRINRSVEIVGAMSLSDIHSANRLTICISVRSTGTQTTTYVDCRKTSNRTASTEESASRGVIAEPSASAGTPRGATCAASCALQVVPACEDNARGSKGQVTAPSTVSLRDTDPLSVPWPRSAIRRAQIVTV